MVEKATVSGGQGTGQEGGEVVEKAIVSCGQGTG